MNPLQSGIATCEVCNLTAPTRRHPCRFEICCSCWYGIPCKGSAPKGALPPFFCTATIDAPPIVRGAERPVNSLSESSACWLWP